MDKICRDLDAEYRELDDVVSKLDRTAWFRKTPFYGWTIFDEVAHIAFFDREALLSVNEPDRFRERSKIVLQDLMNHDHWPLFINPSLGAEHPDALLSIWRRTRSALLDQLGRMNTKNRIAWYGPDMGARSFATARLMETWAHGQDVFDTLHLKRTGTHRLRHVAHIGVTTLAWSFQLRNLPIPEVDIRIELDGPDGERWVWGNPDAITHVIGNAEDFCLVVTQRRNIADTSLKCQGDHVKKWLSIAQAFAGVPQNPPAPGERRVHETD